MITKKNLEMVGISYTIGDNQNDWNQWEEIFKKNNKAENTERWVSIYPNQITLFDPEQGESFLVKNPEISYQVLDFLKEPKVFIRVKYEDVSEEHTQKLQKGDQRVYATSHVMSMFNPFMMLCHIGMIESVLF